jgi:hypothetical protein
MIDHFSVVVVLSECPNVCQDIGPVATVEGLNRKKRYSAG